MCLRRPSATLVVVVLAVLAALLVGCGGGGQTEGGSQDNGSGGSEQQNGGGGSDQQNEGTERDRADRKVRIALGTIASVTPDQNEFTLQPSAEEQGEEPLAFRVRQNTRITIAGEEAELLALQEGQQAKVNYFVVEGTNRARVVEVLGD
jgi:hypothetical protein